MDELPHQYDFDNMPMSPAQETVSLLKEIRDLLTPKTPKVLETPPFNKVYLETAKEAQKSPAPIKAATPKRK